MCSSIPYQPLRASCIDAIIQKPECRSDHALLLPVWTQIPHIVTLGSIWGAEELEMYESMKATSTAKYFLVNEGRLLSAELFRIR
jgi:hypothetical protein